MNLMYPIEARKKNRKRISKTRNGSSIHSGRSGLSNCCLSRIDFRWSFQMSWIERCSHLWNSMQAYNVPFQDFSTDFAVWNSDSQPLLRRFITKTAVNLFLKPIPSIWEWWFRISFEPKWRHSFFNFFPVRSKMINTSHQSQIFFSTE